MPLSMPTRLWLEKQRYDWPFKGKNLIETGKDFIRVFAPERAEWYALAHLYQCSLNDDIPVPYIAEFPDFPDFVENPPDEKAKMARKIQDEIIKHIGAVKPPDKEEAQRLFPNLNKEKARKLLAKLNKAKAQKFFAKLILIGSVFQFWREKQRRPTVLEIAEFMGLSGPAFYRHYTRADLYRELRVACGQVEAQSPDPDGFTSVQRANRKAKKATAKSLELAQDLRAGHMTRQKFASLMGGRTR
jgi:hypothetical protein